MPDESDWGWLNPLTWGERITNAIEIPQSIQIIFQKIGEFLDAVTIVSLTIYVIFTVIVFFALVLLIVYIPIWLYPVYRKNKQLIDKVVKIKSI